MSANDNLYSHDKTGMLIERGLTAFSLLLILVSLGSWALFPNSSEVLVEPEPLPTPADLSPHELYERETWDN